MNVYLDSSKKPELQTGAEPKVTFYVHEAASNGYSFDIQYLLVRSGSLKESERCGEGEDGLVLIMKTPDETVGSWGASNDRIRRWLKQVHEYGGYYASYESDTEVVHNDWIDHDKPNREAIEKMVDHLENDV